MPIVIKGTPWYETFQFCQFLKFTFSEPIKPQILSKIQKRKKNTVKTLPKKTKLALFPRRILACKHVFLLHTAHQTTYTGHFRRHDQSNQIIISIAAALNWSGNAMIWGIVCSTLGRWHQNVAQCCRNI